MKTDQTGSPEQVWNFHPPLPLEPSPVFVWPPRPLGALKYLISVPFLGSVVLPFGAVATLTWTYLQPALERCVNLEAGWIAQLLIRNFLLMLVVAGSLHLYFYVFKLQGQNRKFDRHDMQRNNPRFFLNDQVKDNMFWTLTSGVAMWTGYEVLFMWAYANDWLWHYLDWRLHPVAFVLTFFLVAFWSSLHFYLVHRLLHWRPLFKAAHAVHHRNVNLGPWSGMSMHPIEHLLYLSSVLIHIVLPSHPIHVLFHLQYDALGAAASHTGYDAITVRGRPVFYLTSFHHQLHHKYLDCNYGNPIVSMDRWFDCDHDGSEETLAAVRERQRARATQRRT